MNDDDAKVPRPADCDANREKQAYRWTVESARGYLLTCGGTELEHWLMREVECLAARAAPSSEAPVGAVDECRACGGYGSSVVGSDYGKVRLDCKPCNGTGRPAAPPVSPQGDGPRVGDVYRSNVGDVFALRWPYEDSWFVKHANGDNGLVYATDLADCMLVRRGDEKPQGKS